MTYISSFPGQAWKTAPTPLHHHCHQRPQARLKKREKCPQIFLHFKTLGFSSCSTTSCTRKSRSCCSGGKEEGLEVFSWKNIWEEGQEFEDSFRRFRDCSTVSGATSRIQLSWRTGNGSVRQHGRHWGSCWQGRLWQEEEEKVRNPKVQCLCFIGACDQSRLIRLFISF